MARYFSLISIWQEMPSCIFKCTHIIHIFCRDITSGWLNQWVAWGRGICRTQGVPAGGHRARVQINSTFVYSVVLSGEWCSSCNKSRSHIMSRVHSLHPTIRWGARWQLSHFNTMGGTPRLLTPYMYLLKNISLKNPWKFENTCKCCVTAILN